MHQEEIALLNVYASNSGAAEEVYIKQKVIETKGTVNQSAVLVGET